MEPFLGKYINLDELGQGSFARVILARHIELGYVRTLRVLKDLIVAPRGSNDPKKSEIYQKFLKECEKLLQLGNGCHPNIVRIYKPDLCQNNAFVEMDYVRGNNIHEFLEQSQNFVEYEEVIRLATQISSALAYCHEDIYRFRMDPDKDKLPEGCLVGSIVNDAEKRKELIDTYKIIHNDIHSGNIMRREDGNYILLDFGLSIEGKEIAPSSTRSHGGALITRAPELWDRGTKPTEQSDIYSLGVVLYQCLTGRVPFPCDINELKDDYKAQAELGKAHKETLPPPIEAIRKEFFEKKYPGQTYKRDYPQWLEDVIMKCLSKNPADRFKNGTELYETIMRQEDNLPENRINRLNEEKEELVLRNDTLNSANRSLELQLNQSNASLELAKERIGTLEKKGRRSRLMNVVLPVLCGMCAALCVYLYTNRPAPTNDGKLAECRMKIDQKNDTIAELRELLQRGDDAILAQKDARISELESAIQDLTADMPDVAFLEEQLRKKNAQISKLAGQLDDVKVSLNTRNATVASLEVQLRKKDAQISKLAGQLDDVKASLNTQNAVVNSLKGQLDKKDAQIKGLQKQVSQKDIIVKRKNDEIKELREN